MKHLALYRINKIVWMMISFFVQVVIFQKRNRTQLHDPTVLQKWESLLRRQAAKYRETAVSLEGLLIKLGQFLSSRADILPPVVLKELDALVDQVPPVPWEKAKDVLEAEWGTPYGEKIHKISLEPVASASIGEVYHGYLHTGESVAVKIQRPGVDKIIQTDFRAVKIVMWLAKHFTKFGQQMDLDALYREMRQVIGDELNFKKELENGLYFQKRYEAFPEVVIPHYYKTFSTRKVIVMEWMEGAKITDLAFLKDHQIDRPKLAERLFKVFLEQLLDEGKFHADPHQGNIMVKSDGTIVLIDFGMVGEIKRKDTLAIRELVEAVIFGDWDKAVAALETLRFLLPHANKELLKDVMERTVQLYTAGDLAEFDEEVVQRIMRDIQTIVKEEPIQFPTELAFFGRAVSTFLGILYSIDPNINILELSKPLIKEWLAKSEDGVGASDSFAGAPWIGLVKRYAAPILGLPKKLDALLDEPLRNRQWQEQQEHYRQSVSFQQSRKRDAYGLMILGFIAVVTGFIVDSREVIYLGGTVFVGSVFYYLRALRSYRRVLTIKQPIRKG